VATSEVAGGVFVASPSTKPEVPKRLRDDCGNLLSAFHSEVRRQRLAREKEQRADALAAAIHVLCDQLEALETQP
jgi:hypothetical protein